ncbi:MAG: hypothetical protein K8R21_12865 [Leptospira sp.]|nr:hypothetical protein [Leptospira sp.]
MTRITSNTLLSRSGDPQENTIFIFNNSGKSNARFDYLRETTNASLYEVDSFENFPFEKIEKGEIEFSLLLILEFSKIINEDTRAENLRLVHTLRNKTKYRNAPILYLASVLNPNTKVLCLSSGVDYVTLPITKTEFALQIKKYLSVINELSDLKRQIKNATSLQDYIWEESKKKQTLLVDEIKVIKQDLEMQNMVQDATFELSRQELLEANRKLQDRYENEIKALKEKNEIEAIFGKYVSPEIVQRVMDPSMAKELDGVRREITVFFADIRGFTSFSETLNPEKVIFILNEFFTEMTEIIHDAGGWVDKYTGDNIMALFGAPIEMPDHANKAIAAAFEIQTRFKMLSKEWLTIFNIDAGLRIGIATGITIVGNIGSFKKISYTAIGDTVNVASRLEGKCPDGNVLMNDLCYQNLSEDVRKKFGIVFHGEIDVKGKVLPLKTYACGI